MAVDQNETTSIRVEEARVHSNVVNPIDRLIGETPGIRKIKQQIHAVATSFVPILILGETGTGKELCAGAIRHFPDLAHTCL